MEVDAEELRVGAAKKRFLNHRKSHADRRGKAASSIDTAGATGRSSAGLALILV